MYGNSSDQSGSEAILVAYFSPHSAFLFFQDPNTPFLIVLAEALSHISTKNFTEWVNDGKSAPKSLNSVIITLPFSPL